jgi:hypothetical protein
MNVTYSSSVMLCLEIAIHKHGMHRSCSVRHAVWVARLDRAEPRARKNKEKVYISIKEDNTRKLIWDRLEQNKGRRSCPNWKGK